MYLKFSARRQAFVFESSPPITTRPSRSSLTAVSAACLNWNGKIELPSASAKRLSVLQYEIMHMHLIKRYLFRSLNFVSPTANHIKSTLNDTIKDLDQGLVQLFNANHHIHEPIYSSSKALHPISIKVAFEWKNWSVMKAISFRRKQMMEKHHSHWKMVRQGTYMLTNFDKSNEV